MDIKSHDRCVISTCLCVGTLREVRDLPERGAYITVGGTVNDAEIDGSVKYSFFYNNISRIFQHLFYISRIVQHLFYISRIFQNLFYMSRIFQHLFYISLIFQHLFYISRIFQHLFYISRIFQHLLFKSMMVYMYRWCTFFIQIFDGRLNAVI